MVLCLMYKFTDFYFKFSARTVLTIIILFLLTVISSKEKNISQPNFSVSLVVTWYSLKQD